MKSLNHANKIKQINAIKNPSKVIKKALVAPQSHQCKTTKFYYLQRYSTIKEISPIRSLKSHAASALALFLSRVSALHT